MTSSSERSRRAVEKFKAATAASGKGTGKGKSYVVATEKMSLQDKQAYLEEIGRTDLIDLFKEWAPKTSARKKRGAPLDQRVSITVTNAERAALDMDLRRVKATGESLSMSQFIRNRALGTVDIIGWSDIATKALAEIEETVTNQAAMRKRRMSLIAQMDAEEDATESAIFAAEADTIRRKLEKIVGRNEKRANRLSGRMSMPECETVKWRAQRLCISSSDFLRMMVFGLEPDSTADAHMSLDSKRRFYISIVEVAKNGWGTPPEIYECSQCIHYMDEIRRLKQENQQLVHFA